MELPAVAAKRCSLRTAGVGCPEHAQVGPLPRLSKSRRRGSWVGLADSGVPISCLLGKPHTIRSPSGAGPILRRLLRRNDADMQLLELFGVDLAGSVEHQVLHALGFGECDHIPDVVG